MVAWKPVVSVCFTMISTSHGSDHANQNVGKLEDFNKKVAVVEEKLSSLEIRITFEETLVAHSKDTFQGLEGERQR